MRELKSGDILINELSGYLNIFIYFSKTKKIAKGVAIRKIAGIYTVQKASYDAASVLDEKAFTVLGNICIEKMWIENVLKNVGKLEALKRYDEKGKRKWK